MCISFGKKLSSSDKYDLLKVLNGKLRSEKAECAALQARFLFPDVFSEEKRFEEIKKMPSLSENNLMTETNRLDSANSNLAQLQRDLTEAR